MFTHLEERTLTTSPMHHRRGGLWSGAAALTLFLACGAAVTAEDAPAAATPTPTTNAALERVVISRPDGTREIRWVPRANNSPNRAGTAAARLATQPAAGSGVQPRLTGGSPFGGPNVRISSPAFTGSVNAQGGLVYTPERSTAVGTSAPVRPAVYGAAGAMGDPGTFVGPQPVGGPSRPAPSTNPGALTPGGPGTPPNNPDPQDPGTPTPSDPQDPTPQDPDPRPPTGGGRVIVTGTVPSSAPPAPPPPPPPAPPAPEPTPPTGGGGDEPPPQGDGGHVTPIEPKPFPVLYPGQGWSGPTLQPAPIGNPSAIGYDATAIARWDVVPYQDFDDLFHIGVIAFHMNGIDRVDFSVNNGPWESVYEMRHNPRTNVWEYTVTLDPSLFDDGLIEVRAIAWPKDAGQPRVLAGEIDGFISGNPNFRNGIHSMFLNANAGGSLPRHEVWVDAVHGNDSTGDGSQQRPFRSPTIALAHVTRMHGSSDGAVAYLMPGEYRWDRANHPHNVATSTRWATVQPAPGVSRSSVQFVSNETAGLRTRLLRAHNITSNGHGGPRTTGNMDAYFWMSDSILEGESRFSGGGIASGMNQWAGVYGTDLIVREVRSGVRAATFLRNCLIEGMSDSIFGQDAMVVNCVARDFTRNPNGTHADVFHWFWNNNTVRENRIVYGLSVYQFPLLGLLMNPISTGQQFIKDIAFVNVHISKDDITSATSSLWAIDTEHLVLKNIQLPDQMLRFSVHNHDQDGELTLHNVAIYNSVFLKLSGDSIPYDAIFRNVHVMDTTSHQAWSPSGEGVTLGHRDGGVNRFEVFRDPNNLNYCPRPTSVIGNRIKRSDIQVRADARGKELTAAQGALGAYFAGCNSSTP